jgi:ABC-type enterochelin transport system permease subunit
MGIFIEPTGKILGIPNGLFLFILSHIIFLIFIFEVQVKQPFLPFFFGALFHLLGYLPQFAWLCKWIEGMDILLLLLGVFLILEKEGRKE